MTEAIKPNSDYYLPDNKIVKEKPGSLSDPDAFLKILVAQMKYQNPMQPTDSETFISQLTQMASMEQMFNVGRSMNNLASKYELSRYYEMIGRQVTVVSGDKTVTGRVGGVIIEDNKPYFYLDGAPGGERYTLDQLRSITGVSNLDMLPYLALAGRRVTVDAGGEEVAGTVERVLRQNGGVYVMINGEAYEVDKIIEVFAVPEEPVPEPEEEPGTGRSEAPGEPEPANTP